jgi:predicted DCC family thiol-disulfide oxidoreductase YuxK
LKAVKYQVLDSFFVSPFCGISIISHHPIKQVSFIFESSITLLFLTNPNAETMKNEAEKIMIYDSHCPLCQWYTGEFVKQGMLTENGRLAFEDVTEETFQKLDLVKSRHEIPLMDANGGETLYGLDSLKYMLGLKFPKLIQILNFQPMYKLTKEFYSLISYNRRVISGSNEQGANFNCEPDFNLFYRLLFISLTMIMASFSGILLAKELLNAELIDNVQVFLPAMGLGWIATAMTARVFLDFKSWMDYIGHLGSILAVGVFLFLPWLVFFNLFANPSAIILFVGVGISAFVMIREHFRRIKNYKMPFLLNVIWLVSWVLGTGYLFV